jgi:polysaccharide biosynthesis/export protein
MKQPLSDNFRFTFHACVVYMCIIVLSCTVAPLRAQDRQRSEKHEIQRPQVPSMSAVVEIPVTDSTYIVGPGDELAVSIFATEFYSHTAAVNSDGTIVIPNLGTLYIKNLTLRSVREKLYAILRGEVKRADILVSLSKARQVKVTVSGTVRNPSVVLLPSTARVSEALELAGGKIPDTTSLRNIRIQRIDGQVLSADLLRYFRLGDLDANPFVSSGDNIYFPPRDERVAVFGAVGLEGWIDYVPGETIFQAVEVSQGLRANAFLDSVEIVRFNSDNISTKRFFLNLNGYPNNKTVDMPLQPSDLVLVRTVPKFHLHRIVTLRGEVQRQGSYSIEEGKTTLHDIIMRAGGFTEDASLEEAMMTRKTPENEKDKEYERLAKVPPADMREDEYEYFKARTREHIGLIVVNWKKLFLQNDLSADIFLRDDDMIEIPKIKNYIRVIGRVNNPGSVLFQKDWTYQHYIRAAGGYGWRAKDNDVRVVKARTGELVDASNEKDYELEPGDSIWVPETPEIKLWPLILTGIGVIAQLAGILGIIIAIRSLK